MHVDPGKRPTWQECSNYIALFGSESADETATRVTEMLKGVHSMLATNIEAMRVLLEQWLQKFLQDFGPKALLVRAALCQLHGIACALHCLVGRAGAGLVVLMRCTAWLKWSHGMQ
jgi:hypothetical protein